MILPRAEYFRFMTLRGPCTWGEVALAHPLPSSINNSASTSLPVNSSLWSVLGTVSWSSACYLSIDFCHIVTFSMHVSLSLGCVFLQVIGMCVNGSTWLWYHTDIHEMSTAQSATTTSYCNRLVFYIMSQSYLSILIKINSSSPQFCPCLNR